MRPQALRDHDPKRSIRVTLWSPQGGGPCGLSDSYCLSKRTHFILHLPYLYKRTRCSFVFVLSPPQKFLGVWGLLSRSPHIVFPTNPNLQNNEKKKKGSEGVFVSLICFCRSPSRGIRDSAGSVPCNTLCREARRGDKSRSACRARPAPRG